MKPPPAGCLAAAGGVATATCVEAALVGSIIGRQSSLSLVAACSYRLFFALPFFSSKQVIFSSDRKCEVAVVDAYKGPEKAALKIEDHTDAKTSRYRYLTYADVSLIVCSSGRLSSQNLCCTLQNSAKEWLSGEQFKRFVEE